MFFQSNSLCTSGSSVWSQSFVSVTPPLLFFNFFPFKSLCPSPPFLQLQHVSAYGNISKELGGVLGCNKSRYATQTGWFASRRCIPAFYCTHPLFLGTQQNQDVQIKKTICVLIWLRRGESELLDFCTAERVYAEMLYFYRTSSKVSICPWCLSKCPVWRLCWWRVAGNAIRWAALITLMSHLSCSVPNDHNDLLLSLFRSSIERSNNCHHKVN